MVGLAAVVVGLVAVAPWTAGAAMRHTLPLETLISSPQPDFMQGSGQGPALSGDRVAWTATSGQGQSGSEADRIFAYNLSDRRLSVPVRSHYGSVGFIGSYQLVGSKLAYVDTGFASGGIFTWRVAVTDLSSRRTTTVASSQRHQMSSIPPQIAFDGTRLLLLQTVDLGGTQHESIATLYTPTQRRSQVLERVRNLSFGDPALSHNMAFWTTITFTGHTSSRLTSYDLTKHTRRLLPVGDVSQLAASGNLLVWKSGLAGMGGHIGLYAVDQNRVISTNLAHSDEAIFPTIGGRLVTWTYGDGSRMQVYSVGSARVIYTAPVIHGRVYGLTSISGPAVSWAYTVLAAGKKAPHGYVVVRQVR